MKRGNILFKSSVGREDFPGGMADASVVKVKTVPGLHGRVFVFLLVLVVIFVIDLVFLLLLSLL